MKVKFKIKLILSLISFILLSCVGPFRDSKLYILDFFPRDTDVPGWEQVEGPVINDSNKFGGRVYQHFGIIQSAFSRYRSFSRRDVKINVEIIKCDSILSAFGLFSIDRGFDENIRSVNDFHYMSDKGLFSRAGVFYIRILINSIRFNEDIDVFYTVIYSKIRGAIIEKPIPAHANFFSQYDRSYKNLIFYRYGHPHIPEIKNVFVKKMDIFDKKILIFYSRDGSRLESINRFNSLFRTADNRFILTKIADLKIAFRELEKNRIIFISQYKDWIFGVLNAENIDDGTKIIKKLIDIILKT